MDARLLNPEAYRVKTQPFAMPQAPSPALNDPTAFQVQPGPAGAAAMGEPMPAMPEAPSPAAVLAQPRPAPAAQPGGGSQWTPERKAFAKKINETARNYKQAVDGRRAQRKELNGYAKLKGQLDTAAGTLSDLRNMESTYKDVYTPDSAATMAIQRQQAQHFEKVQRLRDELNKKAQQLSTQFGWKVGKNGGLEDEDSIAGQGDAQFDDEARQTVMDAYMSQPPQ